MTTEWASRRWIRQSYSYDEERQNRITAPGGVITIADQHRYIERITAKTTVATVDSQDVKSAITSTLPNIYRPGGSTDSLSGTTGWTPTVPGVEDADGMTIVTATWTKTTAWSNV